MANQISNPQGELKDEIDLVGLMNKVGSGLLKLFQGILQFLLAILFFLVRKWFFLLLAILIGLGINSLWSHFSEKYYVSNITIRSNAVSNSDMIGHINKLHVFSVEKNNSALSENLGLPIDLVKGIKDIEAFWVIDRNNDYTPDFVDYKNLHNIYDTVNVRMMDRFVVRVKTKKPETLSSIRDALFSYIESNSLFVQQNQLRLSQNKALIARIDQDIKLLDSLQKVKYFEETRNRIPESGGQMIFLQEQKTQLIYEDIQNLYIKKQLIEQQQELFPEIATVLSDFSFPSKPENNAIYYGKKIIPITFFLCLLLILVFDYRKQLEEVLKKS